MKIQFIEKRFSAGSQRLIDIANGIIAEYRAQGFDLTLRQLYYQCVARDIIPNTQDEYKRLGSIINDARLAGLISWAAIVDRTRFVRSNSHWEAPADILRSAAASYLEDRWETQTARVEVWIEKDALVGVIEGVCRQFDVPFFSCRGYVSQSEMFTAGHHRVRRNDRAGQRTILRHLGDHDPSGIDMTRDIDDRIRMFSLNGDFEMRRLALNMAQIEELNPPPNPAKITDSRAAGYIAEYGADSWELDALEPQFIVGLIAKELNTIIDMGPWEKIGQRIADGKFALELVALHWPAVQTWLWDRQKGERS